MPGGGAEPDVWTDWQIAERVAGSPMDTVFWGKWAARLEQTLRLAPPWPIRLVVDPPYTKDVWVDMTAVADNPDSEGNVVEHSEIYVPPWAGRLHARTKVTLRLADPFPPPLMAGKCEFRLDIGGIKSNRWFAWFECVELGDLDICDPGTTAPAGRDGTPNSSGSLFNKTFSWPDPAAYPDGVDAAMLDTVQPMFWEMNFRKEVGTVTQIELNGNYRTPLGSGAARRNWYWRPRPFVV